MDWVVKFSKTVRQIPAERFSGAANSCAPQGRGHRGDRHLHALFCQNGAQFFQRPAHTLLRRVLADTQNDSDLPKLPAFEKPQHERVPIFFPQFFQRRFQPLWKITVGRFHYRRLRGSPFARHAPPVRPQDFGRRETSVPVQPARHDCTARNFRRLARQIPEHHLRHVLSEMRVAPSHSPRGRKYQVQMALHQFPECFLRSAPRVIPQQLFTQRHQIFPP
jgi:hypothetical protein